MILTYGKYMVSYDGGMESIRTVLERRRKAIERRQAGKRRLLLALDHPQAIPR